MWPFPKRHQSAREYRLSQLAKRCPDAVRAANEAASQVLTSHFSEALQLVGRAINLAPSVGDFYDIKAECLNNLGNAQAALEAAIHATTLDPKLATAWVQRSWANISLRESDEALDCAERAIALDENNDMAWNNAGAAHMMHRQFGKAKKCFERAMELNRSNWQAQQNLKTCRQHLN